MRRASALVVESTQAVGCSSVVLLCPTIRFTLATPLTNLHERKVSELFRSCTIS